MKRIVVIGLGNLFRGDDAAGIEVVRRIRDAGPPPWVDVMIEPADRLALLDLWAHADVAYLVDAVSGSGTPGTIHRYEIAGSPLPDRPRRDSTHALGLGEFIELARALGRLPSRVVVIGIEGSTFTAGTELSAPVARAVAKVAELISREVADEHAEGRVR